MNGNTPIILHGAEPYKKISNETLGEQLLNSLKKRDYNDIVAIDSDTGEVHTSGKLIENSIKLATAYKNIGLKKGDIICIISENDIDSCIVVLSAFYIGVAVSLLNPDYTIGELRHAFQLSCPKIIISSNAVLNKATTLKEEYNFITHIIVLGKEDYQYNNKIKNLSYYINTTTADIDNFKTDNFNPSEIASYVLLSSGTTGLPKGVLLTHQNMVVSLANLSDPRYAVIKPEDKLLSVLPFFHMYGTVVQLITLLMPITTIFLKFTPAKYLDAIQKYQPTKLFVVPSLISFLSTNPLVENYNLCSIKECINSGALIEKPICAKMKHKLPSIKVRQMYGMTEASGFCLIHVPNSKEGNIGIPVPTILAKIRDLDTFEPLGPYQNGEMCFKGPTIMKEYIRNKTATDNAFDEDGFYCSGDIGYYDKNNYFYFVSRIKEIIKFKGFQVAPSEIEQLILTHPQVQDCGVIGVPSEKFGEIPLAFVVCKKEQCLSEEEVVDYVAERISVNKQLHGGVRFLDAIPKNPGGKILRTKLKEML